MNLEIEEIYDILELVLPGLSSKPKVRLNLILEELKNLPEENLEVSELMKIQEELESISLVQNMDSYSRNEIINVLSMFEMLF